MTAHETNGDGENAGLSRIQKVVFALVLGWMVLLFGTPGTKERGADLIGLGSLAFYIGIAGVAMTAPVEWAAAAAPLANAAAAAAQYVSEIVAAVGGVFVVWVAVVFVGVVLVAFGMHAALEGEDDG